MRVRGRISEEDEAEVRREQVDSMVFHYQAGEGREAAIQWAIERSWRGDVLTLISDGTGLTKEDLVSIFTSRGVPFREQHARRLFKA
jgi:hypothetical protein